MDALILQQNLLDEESYVEDILQVHPWQNNFF